MKRLLVAAIAFAGLAGPAFAQVDRQAADTEIRGFVSRYVAAFNRADIPGLARDFYAIPGKSAEETSAVLAEGYAALRAEEWGKMNFFAASTCVQDATHAQVQVDYEYQFTYGGAMPPGDRRTVFTLAKSDAGWRITAWNDMPGGQAMACAL
jgi:hypothetical protein